MKSHDYQVLTGLGTALWAAPDEAEFKARETIGTVTLLHLPEDRTVDRAARAMLERATRDGHRATAHGIQSAFYRLSPEERFLLSALHIGRWSFARLARILGRGTDEVSQLAWIARLKLAPPGVAYPYASRSGKNCPPYDPIQPWTQRFLDEEMPVRDRLFLQNHLMACEACRATLARCRNLYFAVEKTLPKSDPDTDWDRALSEFRSEALGAIRPIERTIRESLVIFIGRRDVQVAIGIGFFLVCHHIWL